MKIAQFQQFSFEGCDIGTTVETSGNPWFLSRHVCKVLVIAKSRHILTRVEQKIKSALPTHAASSHLNRANQTLCLCAIRNDGPVKCLRINDRLAWPTDAIPELLGV